MTACAFIYAVGEAGQNLVKVGRSIQPDIRILHLRSQQRWPALQVLHAEHSENAIVAELRAHELLRDARVEGEWFLTEADVAVTAIRRAVYECSQRGLIELAARMVAPLPPVAEHGAT